MKLFLIIGWALILCLFPPFYLFSGPAQEVELSPFLKLVQSGAPAEIIDAIHEGANIHESDALGRTALMWAARANKDPAVLEILLENGADINSRDQSGSTALMHAVIHRNNPDCVRTLLDYGADIRTRSSNQNSPFIELVTYSRDLVLIQRFIDMGADVNQRNGLDETPLIRAAQNNEDVVRLLLDNAADAAAKDNRGRTALHNAAVMSPTMIKMLLDAGADVNAADISNMTPLICAAKENSDPLAVKMLLDHGADIHALGRIENGRGDTALHFAAELNSFEIVRILVERGASVNDRSSIGKTPLMCAAAAGRDAESLHFIVEAGADPLTEDRNNNTVLHFAAGHCPADAIRYLIGLGVEVDSPNTAGFTPFLFACQSNNDIKVLELLLEHGADPYAVSYNGSTALHLASASNCEEIVSFLLTFDFGINDKNDTGSTPLHEAATINDDSGVIRLLLLNDADVNVRNNDGQTPLAGAVLLGKTEQIEILLDYGALPEGSIGEKTLYEYALDHPNLSEHKEILEKLKHGE